MMSEGFFGNFNRNDERLQCKIVFYRYFFNAKYARKIAFVE